MKFIISILAIISKPPHQLGIATLKRFLMEQGFKGKPNLYLKCFTNQQSIMKTICPIGVGAK